LRKKGPSHNINLFNCYLITWSNIEA
jgi:hypothetical protein